MDKNIPQPMTEEELLVAVRLALRTFFPYPLSEAIDAKQKVAARVALIAWNYAVHVLDIEGAGLYERSVEHIVQAFRGSDAPVGILSGEDLMYPKDDPLGRVKKMMRGWLAWAAVEAGRRLVERPGVHPSVQAHWEKLAGLKDGR